MSNNCGLFPELEDQMTAFAPDLERGKMGSPDRVDALVWAMTELLVEQVPYSGLIEYLAAEMVGSKPGRRQPGMPDGFPAASLEATMSRLRKIPSLGHSGLRDFSYLRKVDIVCTNSSVFSDADR
jgi:hypothetical protein